MRGDGRVYQRGGVWWIRYYVAGRQVSEPGGADGRGAAKESEAKARLRARIKEIHGDRYVGPAVERLTIGELLDGYVAHLRQRGAKAVDSIVDHLKAVRGFFPATKAVHLTPDDVRRFLQFRVDGGLSSSTANRGVQYLRAAYRLAAKEGRFPAARVPYFPTMREGDPRKGFFSREEVDAIVANLPQLFGDVVRFAYYSGWRRGEVQTLRWLDVDWTADEIRLPPSHSKNDRPRTLPLEIGELRDVLKRRLEARAFRVPGGVVAESELVFHLRGRELVDWRKSWRNACKAAGVPGRLFHDLRRTAVRDLVRAGVSQPVAKGITGHKTDSVFQRYDIVSDDDRRDALQRLAAYRNAPPAKPGTVVAYRRKRAGGSR